jgi:light-regulated signal transduction histidine kinase (bacteriophytochrome)
LFGQQAILSQKISMIHMRMRMRMQQCGISPTRWQRSDIEIGCERKNNENAYFVRDNGAGFDMRYWY